MSEDDSAKILTMKEGEDEEVWYEYVNAPEPDVRLGYFILSENCNLACKYCFVGDALRKRQPYTKNMTKGMLKRPSTFSRGSLNFSAQL